MTRLPTALPALQGRLIGGPAARSPRRPAWLRTAIACVLALGAARVVAAQDDQRAAAKNDRYLIKLPAAEAPATDQPAEPGAKATFTGRLILFLLPDTQRWSGVEPAAGPFLTAPQLIASVPVRAVAEGSEIRIETDRVADPPGARDQLEELEGPWRVQAVLDVDFTTRGHLGPGNFVSEPTRVEFARDRADEVALTLSRRLAAADRSASDADDAADGVQWFEWKSALLTAARRRETSMKVGVVLPRGYDDLAFPRRIWPAVYVLGDFLEGPRAAVAAAPALRDPLARAAVPQAVWIYLDATTPWGASGFCDSDANGPVARALVEELIPALEERFRLVSQPSARVLLGHGFGGWSAIHLALAAPATFGACYASSPDFVDFSALGSIDLYRDASLFVTRAGDEAPAVRTILGPNDDLVRLTMREQIQAERAVDPDGRSGERWAARDAMWSPWQPERNAPRAICDAATGAVDLVAGEAWSRADIAKRLERSPATIGPLLASRVHILASTRDPFYRNAAVARLKAKLEAWRANERLAGRTVSDRGFIELVDDLDDDALRQLALLRFHREISADLRAAGHADELPLDEGNRATRPSSTARPVPEPPRGR